MDWESISQDSSVVSCFSGKLFEGGRGIPPKSDGEGIEVQERAFGQTCPFFLIQLALSSKDDLSLQMMSCRFSLWEKSHGRTFGQRLKGSFYMGSLHICMTNFFARLPKLFANCPLRNYPLKVARTLKVEASMAHLEVFFAQFRQHLG